MVGAAVETDGSAAATTYTARVHTNAFPQRMLTLAEKYPWAVFEPSASNVKPFAETEKSAELELRSAKDGFTQLDTEFHIGMDVGEPTTVLIGAGWVQTTGTDGVGAGVEGAGVGIAVVVFGTGVGAAVVVEVVGANVLFGAFTTKKILGLSQMDVNTSHITLIAWDSALFDADPAGGVYSMVGTWRSGMRKPERGSPIEKMDNVPLQALHLWVRGCVSLMPSYAVKSQVQSSA